MAMIVRGSLIKPRIGAIILLGAYLMCGSNVNGDTPVNNFEVIPTNDGGVSFMEAMTGGKGKVKETEEAANTEGSIISSIDQDDIVKNMTPLFKCWIDFLCGCTIDLNNLAPKGKELPPHKSAQVFRDNTNDNLESCHNYVQVIFPNQLIGVANRSLFLDSNELMTDKSIALDALLALLKKHPTIASKIKLNLMVNSSRMFQFWGLEYAIDENDKVILKTGNWPDAKKKLSPNDHNNLRVTRVLLALGIFGLNSIRDVFLKALKTNQGKLDGSLSSSYWDKAALTDSKINDNVDNPKSSDAIIVAINKTNELAIDTKTPDTDTKTADVKIVKAKSPGNSDNNSVLNNEIKKIIEDAISPIVEQIVVPMVLRILCTRYPSIQSIIQSSQPNP
jgi:hypothetical protein